MGLRAMILAIAALSVTAPVSSDVEWRFKSNLGPAKYGHRKSGAAAAKRASRKLANIRSRSAK